MSPYDYDHQDYVVEKPHLRWQRARVLFYKLQRSVADQAAALVVLIFLVGMFLVAVQAISLLSALKAFCWFLLIAFMLLLVECVSDVTRGRKR